MFVIAIWIILLGAIAYFGFQTYRINRFSSVVRADIARSFTEEAELIGRGNYSAKKRAQIKYVDVYASYDKFEASRFYDMNFKDMLVYEERE